MIPEIAVSKSVHQTIRERIELVGSARLGTAGSAAAGLSERVNADCRGARECCIRKVGPIDVKFPNSQGVCAKVYEAVRRTSRRRDRPVQVRRQQTAEATAQLKALLVRRRPGEHGSAIKGTSLRANEGSAISEHIVGDVITIRPHTEFWIIVEVCAVRIRVAGIAARGVRCSRNRNTLSVGSGRYRELRQDPSVSSLVILDDRIAVVVVGACRVRKAGPDRVSLFGETGSYRPGNFIKDRKAEIDPLNILGRSDGAVGIRRPDSTA